MVAKTNLKCDALKENNMKYLTSEFYPSKFFKTKCGGSVKELIPGGWRFCYNHWKATMPMRTNADLIVNFEKEYKRKGGKN